MQTEAYEVERDVHQELRAEREKKKAWRLFALILLAVILHNTKTKERQ